jgi:predicted nucleic acid-binding protein
MKEKVYIDSTIPSYYHDERDSLRTFIHITRQWWDEESENYEIVISEAVIQELGMGDYPNRELILEMVKDIHLLAGVLELEHITQFYIDNYVMPKSLIGDAVHLAYASYYNIEYLLTWNCNHLANANKRRHIRVINGRLGINTPEIITPLELFRESQDDNK